MNNKPVVIIGAGPAGLAAAYELSKEGIQPFVIEKTGTVGGIARTETYKGFHFDIGGHRFFTKMEEINQLWYEMLGDDFLEVSRMSRIYYGGRFYNYPLRIFNTFFNLGILESLLILLSFFKMKLKPYTEEVNFDTLLSSILGSATFTMALKEHDLPISLKTNLMFGTAKQRSIYQGD
jgi:protoporphyrinogen oxidase